MDYRQLAQQMMQSFYCFGKIRPEKHFTGSIRGEPFILKFLYCRKTAALPGEISSEMNISTARIAAALNSLDKKGLVMREIDKSDRRKILVTLTEEGKNTAREIEEEFLERSAALLQDLGEYDAKELVRILTRLSDNVKNKKES